MGSPALGFAGPGSGSIAGFGVPAAGGFSSLSGPGPATTASLPLGAGPSSGPSSGGGEIAFVSLPASLAPLDVVGGTRASEFFPGVGLVTGTPEDLRRFRVALRSRPGTPAQIVKQAREAIVAAALPYGVVRVDAASAGPIERTRNGYVAPIEFKMVYSRQGGLETRQSTVRVRLNDQGRVVAAL